MKVVRIKIRYSIEPRDKIFVKRYGFLSFVKNMDKSLSNKYGQKLLDSTKKSIEHQKEIKKSISKNSRSNC